MNLHIVPDSKFSQVFYHNLQEIQYLKNNKIVVRTNKPKLSFITQDLPFAPLYSSGFSSHVGDVSKYEKVFIHQLSPLMYRWIANHTFRELNWMVWGTDLYTLPFVRFYPYESLTRQYLKKKYLQDNFLYLLKVYTTNMPFKSKAYSKISHVLTWMKSEVQFAADHISDLHATHRFFFYENQNPYELLTSVKARNPEKEGALRIVVGNSGTPTNNHLDAIKRIADSGVKADLLILLSYGEKSYIEFIKKNLSFYRNGKIEFVERHMEFREYVDFLGSADALVMNHIRPQGYGNIFMMMCLGKPVFMNEKNISLPDLREAGFRWHDLSEFGTLDKKTVVFPNQEKILQLFSHQKLVAIYSELFS